MSLHGRCVTQHCDSLRKITSVLDTEKLPLAEVFDFPFCYLPSVGDFSCGQHGCSAPALCPQTDPLAANSQLLYTLSLLLSQFSSSLSLTLGFVPAFLTLYLIPSVSVPASTLHLLFPILLPLSRYLSLCQGANVGLQMKQLDFHLRLPGIDICFSVSGRALCLSDALTGENGQANALNSSRVNMAHRLP